jgi:hypothetical protein
VIKSIRISDQLIRARRGSVIRLSVLKKHKERVIESLRIGKDRYDLWSRVEMGHSSNKREVLIFATIKKDGWENPLSFEEVVLMKDCFDGFVERVDIFLPNQKEKDDHK